MHPPPAFAHASVAERPSPAVSVGPGAVSVTVIRRGYTLRIAVHPNRVAAPSSIALDLSRNGRHVRTASVRLSVAMLDMGQMVPQRYTLTETRRGVYARTVAGVPMGGRLGLAFTVLANPSTSFTALLVDHVEG